MKIEKINEAFGRYAEWLLGVRWRALIAFVAVLVLSMMGMKRMVKETSFDDYFLEGDPMLVKTEEFKSHFGNDYYVGVLTQCDNHFTKENLTTLRALSILQPLPQRTPLHPSRAGLPQPRLSLPWRLSARL